MNQSSKLEEGKHVDIRTVEKESLVDIDSVKINPELERKERVQEYIRQIKNPYCFICNGIIVKVNFCDSEEPLERQLSNYFTTI